VPAYPLASNLPGAQPDGGYGTGAGRDAQSAAAAVQGALREQLRALIIEELQQLIRG
jgi:hypothetical protein